MEHFKKVFDTRLLLQIASVLATALLFKAISAHFNFSWAAALAIG